MRVMHVAETLQGGVATYVDALVSKQVDEDAVEDVCICAPRSQSSFLVLSAGKMLGTRNKKRNALGIMVFFFDVIINIFRFKPDIIHLHSTFAGFVFRLALFPFFKDRIVYCPHGWAFLAERNERLNVAIAWIEKILQCGCRKIVNISGFEHSYALESGFSSMKMELVPNGIERPPIWSGKRPIGFDRTPYNIVFVGRLDRQKGGDIFLEVAERVLMKRQDVTFHVVGESVVSQDICRESKGDNVVFHGWVAHQDVFDFFHCGDVLVMPSRWEGFGLVAAEAIACGCFVLSSDRGALPEVILDGFGLSVSMDDFVKDATEYLFNNIEFISKGTFDPEGFIRKYSFEGLSKSTLEIYKGIV